MNYACISLSIWNQCIYHIDLGKLPIWCIAFTNMLDYWGILQTLFLMLYIYVEEYRTKSVKWNIVFLIVQLSFPIHQLNLFYILSYL